VERGEVLLVVVVLAVVVERVDHPELRVAEVPVELPEAEVHQVLVVVAEPPVAEELQVLVVVVVVVE
jgi:hypothetical protein